MFYYTSQNPSAPQLSNRWGDLNRVINYVLDGGSSFPIDRIEWYKEQYIKVYYTGEQPIYNFETFVISGSVDYDNKKFLATSVNIVEKYIIARNTSVPNISFVDINNVGMTAKIVGCGAKRKHGGISYNRTVIRFGEKFDIRIDDRNIGDLFVPAITWGNNSYKFIRICGSPNFETLDYTTKRQIPFNSELPNLNFQPTNNYVSENIFAYNARGYYLHLAGSSELENSPTWRIWSNDKAMYIHLQTSGCTFVCGFGLYDCYNKEIDNGFIYSTKTNHRYNEGNIDSIYVNTRGSFGADYSSRHYDSSNNHINHALIYDNGTGFPEYYRQYGEFGLYQSLSGNGGVLINNMSNNTIFHSDIIISNASRNQYFGKYYDLRWVISALNLPHDYVYIDVEKNKMYMSMRTTFRNEVYHNSIIFVELNYE